MKGTPAALSKKALAAVSRDWISWVFLGFLELLELVLELVQELLELVLSLSLSYLNVFLVSAVGVHV